MPVVVSVAQGGTGANTSATSLTALGAVAKAGDTMTGQLNISAGGLLVTGNSNFDTGTLFVDSVNDRVGIGTSSPGTKLHIDGGAASTYVRVSNTGSTNGLYVGVDSAGESLLSAVDAKPMKFLTTNTERMRIDSSGNVGIGGTAGAETKLHVLGTYPTSSNVSRGVFVGGTIPSGTTTSFTGVLSFQYTNASFNITDFYHFNAAGASLAGGATVTNNYGFVVGSGNTYGTNNYGFYSNIASASNRWNFYAAGTAQNYFAGNVGIGTTTIGTTLDTRGANKTVSNQYGIANIYSTDAFAIDKGGSLSFGGKYASDGSFQTFASIAGRKESSSDGSWSGYLQFVTGTTPTERMRIDSAGNVGIGTASPGATLEVAGGATNGLARIGQLQFKNSSGSYSAGTDGIHMFPFSDGILYSDNYDGGFAWRTGTSSTERMRIDSSGNVGIGGTADAYARCHVLGTLPTSSQISVGFRQTGTVPSGTTSGAYGYNNNLITQAAAFTLSTYYHYFAYQNTIGSGSAVTNQYGYFVDSTLTGATNNFGFYSNIASASNRWNFYAAGTAQNYFAGNTGVGVSPSYRLQVDNPSASVGTDAFVVQNSGVSTTGHTAGMRFRYIGAEPAAIRAILTNLSNGEGSLAFYTSSDGSGANITERMRIDSSGRGFFGTTSTDLCNGNVVGIGFGTTQNGTAAVGASQFSASSNAGINVNRKTDDGNLVTFYQDGTLEGSISVAGNTVSYNAFAGSHWSQLKDDSKPDILRGTVMESINELCAWPGEQNERLPKSKVSDTAGSKKVYGVFMAWDNDWTETNDMLVTSVGAFVCRVNSGVTVQEGDLLESNGDGTARVQADDIIRSSTIGKVTSTVKTHQYADGSYCVPTVLYCG